VRNKITGNSKKYRIGFVPDNFASWFVIWITQYAIIVIPPSLSGVSNSSLARISFVISSFIYENNKGKTILTVSITIDVSLRADTGLYVDKV
jgi:hypothetical protein